MAGPQEVPHNLMDVFPVQGGGKAIDFLDAQGEMCRLLVGVSKKPSIKGILFLEHSGDDQKGNPNFKMGMVIRDDGDGPIYSSAFAISATQRQFRNMNLSAADDGPPRPSKLVTDFIEKWS